MSLLLIIIKVIMIAAAALFVLLPAVFAAVWFILFVKSIVFPSKNRDIY